MSKKELELKRKKTWFSYHLPGGTAIHRRKINAIFFNPTNSEVHELAKAKVCYQLQFAGKQFITEAVHNKTNKRVDVVCLDDGDELEIIYKHESDEQIAQYRKDGVTAVIVEPMTCELCKNIYPKRNKTNICSLCKRK